MMPETLFWGELEAQTIIGGGATPLPHVWPTVGWLGAYSLAKPAWLVAIGLASYDANPDPDPDPLTLTPTLTLTLTLTLISEAQ